MSQDIGDTMSQVIGDTGRRPADARPCRRPAWSSPPSFVEHQTRAEVAARYGVHRAWVYKLKARYEAEGEAALRAPLPAPEDLTDRDPGRRRSS